MSRNAKTISGTDAGRALAAAKKPVTLRCSVCLRKFSTVDPKRALYCSNSCKVRAYRARRETAQEARP
jgi:hypothetical protein